MWTTVVASTALAIATLALTVSGQAAFECPEKIGYYPDTQFCDKYYDCEGGVPTTKNCIDGFVFNPANPRIEACDFPFAVNCGTRTELQDPQVLDPECHRANGYFAHIDASLCNQFYFCNAGKVSKLTCPEGLHFSREQGNCAWPVASGRTGCITRTEELGFTCPSVSTERAAAHPRYPDPEDCKFFFVCVNGKVPRRTGCDFGSVFNPANEQCDSANNVLGCEGYYKEQFSQLINNAGGIGNVDLVDTIANSFTIPEDRGTNNVNANNRRRQPVAAAAAAAVNAPAPTRTTSRQRPGAVSAVRPGPQGPATRPEAQSPPANKPLRRRRPGAVRRRRTTTTTTPAPEYYYDDADYYDYDEEVVVQPDAAAPPPQTPVAAPAPVPQEPAPVVEAVDVEPAPQPTSSSRPRIRPAFVRPQRRPQRERQ